MLTKKLIYTKRLTALITFQDITHRGFEQCLDHADSEIARSQVLRAESVLHKQNLSSHGTDEILMSKKLGRRHPPRQASLQGLSKPRQQVSSQRWPFFPITDVSEPSTPRSDIQ